MLQKIKPKPQKKDNSSWRGFRIVGTISFNETGVLASVLNPLANEKIGILAFSTFDTDYVFVQSKNIKRAIKILHLSGHKIINR